MRSNTSDVPAEDLVESITFFIISVAFTLKTLRKAQELLEESHRAPLSRHERIATSALLRSVEEDLHKYKKALENPKLMKGKRVPTMELIQSSSHLCVPGLTEMTLEERKQFDPLLKLEVTKELLPNML